MVLQTSLQKQLKTKIPARKHTHTHTGLIPAVSSNSFIHGAVMIASRHFLFRLMEMSAGTTGIHAKRKKKITTDIFQNFPEALQSNKMKQLVYRYLSVYTD